MEKEQFLNLESKIKNKWDDLKKQEKILIKETAFLNLIQKVQFLKDNFEQDTKILIDFWYNSSSNKVHIFYLKGNRKIYKESPYASISSEKLKELGFDIDLPSYFNFSPEKYNKKCIVVENNDIGHHKFLNNLIPDFINEFNLFVMENSLKDKSKDKEKKLKI